VCGKPNPSMQCPFCLLYIREKTGLSMSEQSLMENVAGVCEGASYVEAPEDAMSDLAGYILLAKQKVELIEARAG